MLHQLQLLNLMIQKVHVYEHVQHLHFQWRQCLSHLLRKRHLLHIQLLVHNLPKQMDNLGIQDKEYHILVDI